MKNFDLKKYLTEGKLLKENTNLTEGMDSGTDVDTMTDVGTYVVDTLNDFLDPGKTITFEVEYNDDLSISVMHGIDAQRVRENISENRYDLDDETSPLYILNDTEDDVNILNDLIEKYGLDVLLMWLSSGEYGSGIYDQEEPYNTN